MNTKDNKNNLDNQKKLKIMIIDNDPLSLEFISNMVRLTPNFELYAKYQNLYEAFDNSFDHANSTDSDNKNHNKESDQDKSTDKPHANKPDIILTDISIPGTTPLDLVKRLKDIFPKVKVLFMSAASSKKDSSMLNSVKKAGGSGYIDKVQSMNAMLETIKIISSVDVDKDKSFFCNASNFDIKNNYSSETDDKISA